MRRIAAIAFGALAIAGCLFPSLDGLSVDGGADDATLPSDGATDASDATDSASDAAPGFSCAQVDARFCEDFDDSDSSTFSHWTTSSQSHGGVFARVSSDASAPFAVRFDSYGWDSGSSPTAYLKENFPTPITTIAKLGFDLRIDQWPSTSNASFNTGAIVLAPGGGGTSLLLRQNGSQLEEDVPTDAGTTYPTFSLTKNPMVGQWVRVGITWTVSPNTVSVFFDGQPVLGPITLDPRVVIGIPYIEMGETYASSSNDRTSLVIDNIVFDFQ